MNRLWYVGDGIYGFRRWVFATVAWRLPGRYSRLLDPGLPVGWMWNARKDGRGLYARHDS